MGAALRFVHVGRRHQDGDAVGEELGQQLPELTARHRVDAGRRLVEQNQLGLVHQRAGERQLLLHAAGEAIRQTVAERCELRHLEEPAATSLVVRDAMDLGEEGHVLVDREIAVQAEALGQVTDPLRNPPVIARRILVEDAHLARVSVKQAAHQSNRRRLAGAVGSDETEHLAACNLEGQARQRLGAAVALDDAGERDCSLVGRPLPARRGFSGGGPDRRRWRVSHWTCSSASTGMPCLSVPARLSTATLMR